MKHRLHLRAGASGPSVRAVSQGLCALGFSLVWVGGGGGGQAGAVYRKGTGRKKNEHVTHQGAGADT
jgi:hypothetical protein